MEFGALQHALAVGPSKNTIELPNSLISQEVLMEACSNLLVISSDSSPTVYLAHETVRGFLKKCAQEHTWIYEEYYQFPIVEVCLEYLLLDFFSSGPYPPADIPLRLREYPFLSYASRFWGWHALRAELTPSLTGKILSLLIDDQKRSSFLQIAIYEEKKEKENSEDKNEDADSYESGIALNSSPLHIAVAFTLPTISEELLKKGYYPLEPDMQGNTALSLALSRKDNWPMISLLQDHPSVERENKKTYEEYVAQLERN
jgi:hypothetical protein